MEKEVLRIIAIGLGPVLKKSSDPGSASPFFRDELLAPVLHFVSVDRGKKGLRGKRTAGDKPEEGEDDVKSSCPLCPGRHTCYNGRDKGSRSREGELTPKPVLSSDCRLQLACMKPESLVIAGQPYGGEFVPGPCTHRPSHYGSWPCPKSLP
ncbi:hypothetical protein KFK09_001849 [Dendrobium nobile]|uniref:Uncharacterized protein n=1 Tax=Dendrobium nobile TaxID=94219 RepID=A0A8T3CC39_DENNO|nr:hypothetical protein KFK09_001849 [Dendrobium nobile]